MAGILDINSVIKDKGIEYVESLFDNEIIIEEKIAGSTIYLERKGNDIIIYKNNKQPISIIDRTIMKFYDRAIEHFNKLSIVDKVLIPEGVLFHFKYIPNSLNNIIYYNDVPESGLILTYFTNKNDDNKNHLEDWDKFKGELKRYSEILKTDYLRNIYNGKIDSFQKVKILNFISNGDSLENQNFSEYLINTLNIKCDSTNFKKDLTGNVESFILTFKNNKKSISLKMMDPFFKETLINRTDNEDEAKELLNIISSDIVEFVEENIDNLPIVNGLTIEERYINIISELFKKFIDNSNHKFDELIIKLPKFMNKDEFSMNMEFIKDYETLKLIEDDNYRHIFKIFLSLYRKRKRKTNEFISPYIIKYQNNQVTKINNILSNELKEGELPSFIDFLNSDKNIDNNESDSLLPNNEDFDNMTTMSVLSYWQNILGSAYSDKINSNKEDNKIHYVIGNFHPFTKMHEKFCNQIYDETGNKIILVQINESISKYTPFSKDVIKAQMDIIKNENDIIEDYVIFNKSIDLNNIIFKLESHPDSKFYVESNEFEYYKSQLDYYLNFISNSSNEILKMDIYNDNEFIPSNEDKAIKCIKNGDFDEFRKLTPDYIHSIFLKMSTEIKNSNIL